jgi:ascorbate PTS system EIIA or EIIAB component
MPHATSTPSCVSNPDRKAPRVTLASLLNEHTVRARVAAESIDDAIAAAGRLLVDTGAADEGYITAMQAAVREIGPYIVVAPGVAIPHARPEDGARAVGVSVITLDEPVAFGHEVNDPVEVVVAFSATDKSTHLDVLQQLARLLSNHDVLEALRSQGDDAGLLSTLRERAAQVA